MRTEARDPVIKALRRFKPTKFAVTLRNGDRKDLELSTRSNKWEILSNTLGALPWSRIEACNDAGAILGALDREVEEEADDVEEVSGLTDDVGQLVKIMQNVQRSTMEECRRMFADQTRVQGEMAAAMMDSMRVMQESYQMAIKMTAMAGASSAGGEDGNQEDAVMKLMQMGMAMKFGTPMPTPPKPQPPADRSARAPAPNGNALAKTP